MAPGALLQFLSTPFFNETAAMNRALVSKDIVDISV
jgi:hypothetical protein